MTTATSGQRTHGWRALLSSARAYQHVQDALGARTFQRRLVEEYVRPPAGARWLDLGCGTAALLEHLPADVAYWGLDPSARYIAAARARWGERGTFRVASATASDVVAPRAFDRVTAIGVLHHLADDDARGLAVTAAAALADDGALVTYDGAYTPTTSRLARALLDRDRGRHVRAPADYVALLRDCFASITVVEVTGHLRIPYTGCVITARQPVRSLSPLSPSGDDEPRRAQ